MLAKEDRGYKRPFLGNSTEKLKSILGHGIKYKRKLYICVVLNFTLYSALHDTFRDAVASKA